jgi:hypothetical protein
MIERSLLYELGYFPWSDSTSYLQQIQLTEQPVVAKEVCTKGFLFTKKLTFKEYDNEYLDTNETTDTDFGE